MKICILGGSGRVGSQIIQQALTRGRYVTTLVRHPEKVSISHPQLTIVAGDATHTQDIIKAAQGADIVVTAVSVGLVHDKPTHVYSRVTQAVIQARPDLQATQYIVMSSTGTHHGRRELSWVLRWGYEWFLGDAADDKELEEKLLSDSDIDWTVIKAVRLTDEDDTNYGTMDFEDYHPSLTHKVSRKAVANAICDISQNSTHIGQKIVVM